MKNQTGFTLIELLICIFLGTLMLLLGATFFLSVPFATAGAWATVILVFALCFFFVNSTLTFVVAVIFLGLLFFTEKGYDYRKCIATPEGGFVVCGNQITVSKPEPTQ